MFTYIYHKKEKERQIICMISLTEYHWSLGRDFMAKLANQFAQFPS